MTIMLVNVPDEYDPMPDNDWLKLAAREEDDSPKHLDLVHGDFAADGYRLHLAHNGEGCECGSPIHDAAAKTYTEQSAKIKKTVTVQKRFILDALAGMTDSSEWITIGVIDGKSPVFFQCGDGDETRTAMIMPLDVKAKIKEWKRGEK